MMDQVENITTEHVIDIQSTVGAPSTDPSHGTNVLNPSQHHARNLDRDSYLLLKTKWWMQLYLSVAQILAAVLVLYISKDYHLHMSKDEVLAHFHILLFCWIIGYASGCAALVSILCCRLHYHTQASIVGGSQIVRVPNPRLKNIVEGCSVALDCFFILLAILWLGLTLTWAYDDHLSVSLYHAVLYRLSTVFLAICYIQYFQPWVLYLIVCCCCLPCILPLGLSRFKNQNKGATLELIGSLPTYKFEINKISNANCRENNSAAVEGGVVAAGTDKERAISGEDAECCICLANYENNDELRELPCLHIFHKECVDKWLKINAICPLCNSEVIPCKVLKLGYLLSGG